MNGKPCKAADSVTRTFVQNVQVFKILKKRVVTLRQKSGKLRQTFSTS